MCYVTVVTETLHSNGRRVALRCSVLELSSADYINDVITLKPFIILHV